MAMSKDRYGMINNKDIYFSNKTLGGHYAELKSEWQFNTTKVKNEGGAFISINKVLMKILYTENDLNTVTTL